MTYPTLEQVENASRRELGTWYRFLPSPGNRAIGESREVFKEVMEEEIQIMDRICERFKELGGFDSQLSKSIGW